MMPLPQYQFQPLPQSYPLPQLEPPGTRKRRREEGSPSSASADGDTLDSAAKRRAVAPDGIFRIAVPSRQIGKAIGKVGHRVQKIREETKAAIKIADAIAVKGCQCDAENAQQQIANLILKEDDSNSEASKVAAGHVAANTIRLLIAGSQAGSLIGISGQNIEKLRNSSGATIVVLAQNQLPLRASAYESDRVVPISGDVPAVLKALEEIGHQLRFLVVLIVTISPTYNYSLIRPAQPFVEPTSADYVTFEMMISETMVGGLIRCGSNISKIRSESGAMIKVYGGKGEQKRRQIQFGGSAQ
ncbi:poly(rC)-binding protein 4-like isoform X2 [Tripterygium wilfordii]|uniref:Poly(RC)-binding protein 4-like isoform X2 n=1 Tax=Tripterygium wilfordii TaxID=458696 RepID=A0A7J7CG07_TRIWF|nr:poly(rC)-binding protein 4-like isoform X2 [Tripterygium wilfordii]